MRTYITALFFLLIYNTTQAQSINLAKVDNLMNLLDKHGLAMGSLAISVNGKICYQKAIGGAYIGKSEKSIHANSDTKYRVGSISKLLTAIMVFQLIDEGRLRLDQTIASYFPQLPNAEKITIGNLLSHRSGLHDYTKDTNYFEDWAYRPLTEEELLKIILQRGSDTLPNTKTDYNNSNYLILSYIIEKASNIPYSDALNKMIVGKLGLKNTYFGGPANTKKNESFSYSYKDNKWLIERETNLSNHSGAGGIISNPTDLAIILDALFSGRLTSASSLNTMKLITDGFGFGLQTWTIKEETGYGKGGKIDGFLANAYYFPKQKMSVVYCTNGYIYPMDDIYNAILAFCLSYKDDVELFKPTAKPNLNIYTGKYSAMRLPITVVVNADGLNITAETKGQIFNLEPLGINRFMNKPHGYFFYFDPKKDLLVIKEKDNIYYLKKTTQ
jgi:D-alanyl-D-alanine carboxypeptidase